MSGRPGRKPASARSSVEAMCRHFAQKTTRSERTIRFYREELRAVIKELEYGGRHTLPWEIDEEDVRWLLDRYIEKRLAVSTRKGYCSALTTWTKFYGNDIMSTMEIKWPQDMRPKVDWLSEEQARQLLAIEKTPIQEIIVHCELCLGMRRIEVMRLRPDSFKGTHVEIMGKGPQGGKMRSMPYHRDTQHALDRYMEFRDSLIRTVRLQRPKAEVPDTLLIWGRGKALHEYCDKATGIDEIMKDLSAQVGIKFSHHTLRRTFGRTMFRSGVNVATIAKMMGHESTEMTLRYIGVDLDDMNNAMRSFVL